MVISSQPPALDARTDGELLAAAGNEPAAFGEFYLRHGNRVYAFFRRRCPDAQDAFDLVAETFAQALSSLADFDGTRGAPAAWLFGIAKNQYRRYARNGAVEGRARQRLEVAAIVLGPDASERLDEMIDLDAPLGEIHPAIDRLPGTLRDAVRMRYLDERTYEEIALHLDIEPAAARKRVSRGLRQLEHLMPANPFVLHD